MNGMGFDKNCTLRRVTMKNLRILVAGAGGFIGSHMAKRLYDEGNFVRAVDIKWDGYFEEPYYSEKLTLDLRKYENCLKVTKDIDYVYQYSADMGGIGYITAVGADIMHNSALININMLQAFVENRVKRFFFSSSACVYPEYKQLDPNVTALKEEDAHPAQPDQFYGWEKLFTEKLCEGYRKDYRLDIRVARFHNIYGPYGTWDGGKEKAPAALCRKVAEASNPGVIEIWGDGLQTRSFCYIDDCIEGCIRLMASDFSGPLNIGSDELVTIDRLADLVIKVSGKAISKKYDPSKPQGVRGRNSDNTLIKKVLGWAPSISLEGGVKRTYPWVAQQVEKRNGKKI
jgi:GDP-D-mannose 3',5'-epimerase